jgi:phospholipid/cholesterol/gamma-HCH transport system substrate-binding protein
LPTSTTNGSPTNQRGTALPRAVAAGTLVLAIGLLAYLLLRGNGEHTYRLVFQNAGQLVKGDDVQVGGRGIGSIKQIELTDHNQAEIKIAVGKEFSPLHRGTSAVIRATSLSGIANRYIALTLGPQSAPKLADGATLTSEKTTTPVDLDQLFDTFDKPTRKSLQDVIQGSATQYAGKGPQANASARYFSPALSSTNQLIQEVLRDQSNFTDFIVNSSKLVTALADRRDDLSSLISNANATTGAIAAEQTALDRALVLLPGTLRKANTTFVNLRSTLDDLDVLVAESKPATKDLAPFLARLRPLVASARPTIRDLRLLVGQRGANNDLTDAVVKLPKLQRVASPAFKDTILALQKALPVVQFARPYTPDLIGWIRDFGQGAATYDANGHYARIQPVFNAYTYDGSNNTLTPNNTSERLNGLKVGLKRCPGAASQVPEDNSAPFLDSPPIDCDSSLIPPGP